MFGGSQVAASPSPLASLVGPSTASQVQRIVGQVDAGLRVPALRAFVPGVAKREDMIDLYPAGRGDSAAEVDGVPGVGVVQDADQDGAAIAVEGGGGEVTVQDVVARVAAVVPVWVVVRGCCGQLRLRRWAVRRAAG